METDEHSKQGSLIFRPRVVLLREPGKTSAKNDEKHQEVAPEKERIPGSSIKDITHSAKTESRHRLRKQGAADLRKTRGLPEGKRSEQETVQKITTMADNRKKESGLFALFTIILQILVTVCVLVRLTEPIWRTSQETKTKTTSLQRRTGLRKQRI